MAADETGSDPNSEPSKCDSRIEDSAAQFLIDRIDYERTSDIPYGKREFKLERMRKLLHRLGNPQNGLRVIHVAGSKGKGSTSTMIASMLTASGLRTGLFTSPHLLKLEERFCIDGQEIASRELARLIENDIQPVVRRLDAEAGAAGKPWDTPTFFEIVTAVAMVYFRQQRVDMAVLEVGLGGRLDSTNVCQPDCCVVTSISLDHTKQLGTTHAEIAAEKAGILKSGVPLVTGVDHPEALTTISALAKELDCEQWTLGQDFDFVSRASLDPPELDFAMRTDGDNDRLVGCGLPPQMDGLQLGMWGEHQAANAAVAVMVMRILAAAETPARQSETLEPANTATIAAAEDQSITESAIRKGLRSAECAARIEVVSSDPVIVVDAAHNLASMTAMTKTLDVRFDSKPGERAVVFATSLGKKYKQMLQRLIPWCGPLILTKYQDNPRGIPIEKLVAAAKQLGAQQVLMASDPAEAVELAKQWANENDRRMICVTGSFFLAAEVLRELGR